MNRFTKILIAAILIPVGLTSCTDDCDTDAPGLYIASIPGVLSDADLIVKEVGCEEITIEAPLDGFDMIKIDAEITGSVSEQITIPEQDLGDGVLINGEGTYAADSINLTYSIVVSSTENYGYTLKAKR